MIILGHLSRMAHMVKEICFSDKPKLLLTYFNIIKEIK